MEGGRDRVAGPWPQSLFQGGSMMITKNPEVAPIVRRSDVPFAYRNPWNEFQEMRRGMDDLFSHYLGYTPLSRLIPGEAPIAPVFEPLVDIYETAEEILCF